MTNISTVAPRYIPCPFARESDSVFVLKDSATEDSVDFAEGLKPVLESGGTYFSRGQLNGMVNAATNVPFFLQCGGYFTFDEQISNYIGGYPRGAVLTYVAGDEFAFVVSLKDDNKDNFVKNPAYIDGKSWALTRKALIYPDYRCQYIPTGIVRDGIYTAADWPNAGKQKLAYYYPVPGAATTLKLTSARNVPVYENNDQTTGNDNFKAFDIEKWRKQDDTAVYFRVKGNNNLYDQVVDPPDVWEGKSSGRGKMEIGGRISLHTKGWVYLSLARIANTVKTVNACGGVKYKEGTPNCALITISDEPISNIASGTVISSSYSANKLRHQCYGWSLQLLVRKPCYLTIWQNCPSFDMFYNYFGLKK